MSVGLCLPTFASKSPAKMVIVEHFFVHLLNHLNQGWGNVEWNYRFL